MMSRRPHPKDTIIITVATQPFINIIHSFSPWSFLLPLLCNSQLGQHHFALLIKYYVDFDCFKGGLYSSANYIHINNRAI